MQQNVCLIITLLYDYSNRYVAVDHANKYVLI